MIFILLASRNFHFLLDCSTAPTHDIVNFLASSQKGTKVCLTKTLILRSFKYQWLLPAKIVMTAPSQINVFAEKTMPGQNSCSGYLRNMQIRTFTISVLAKDYSVSRQVGWNPGEIFPEATQHGTHGQVYETLRKMMSARKQEKSCSRSCLCYSIDPNCCSARF